MWGTPALLAHMAQNTKSEFDVDSPPPSCTSSAWASVPILAFYHAKASTLVGSTPPPPLLSG